MVFNLDPFSLVIGVIIGVAIGFTGYHYYICNQEDEGKKIALSNIASFLFFLLWVYWHYQAANGSLLGVPAIFDAVGGISAGIVFGLDATIAVNLFSKYLGKK